VPFLCPCMFLHLCPHNDPLPVPTIVCFASNPVPFLSPRSPLSFCPLSLHHSVPTVCLIPGHHLCPRCPQPLPRSPPLPVPPLNHPLCQRRLILPQHFCPQFCAHSLSLTKITSVPCLTTTLSPASLLPLLVITPQLLDSCAKPVSSTACPLPQRLCPRHKAFCANFVGPAHEL